MKLVHHWRAWSLGFALTLVISAGAASKQGRLSGTVLESSKTEITIEKGTVRRVIEVSAATNLTTAGNAQVVTSADQVKQGNYITCVGTWDGVKLAADKCTVRLAKRP